MDYCFLGAYLKSLAIVKKRGFVTYKILCLILLVMLFYVLLLPYRHFYRVRAYKVMELCLNLQRLCVLRLSVFREINHVSDLF